MISPTGADLGLPVRGRLDDGQALNPVALGRLVRATAAAADDWRDIVQFTEGSRWFQRLALTADYEIWLLTWLPGQRTGFHDHGRARGAFTVTCGKLVETLAIAGNSRVRRRVAAEGSVTTFGGHHLHDVGCNSAEPAISVHAYSPPLSAMQRYVMTDVGLKLIGTERAEQDW
jgi:predicted metal-dependent enzyme (double-stranded beta helix superfamily)